MIFTSPSRVDANLFMEATASEIGLPCIQMHMDEHVAGSSVLCMMAPADSNFRLNPSRTGFNGKGILMLEDVDTWDFPDPSELGGEDGIAGFFNAQMSRGIAEVSNLIEVALEDPNILVMATVGDKVDEDEIRNSLGAETFTVIRIDNPTERERAAI
ncbi:MAG: ribonucleotide reductase subunit alpha, partial [Coriobacteriia bacterium]|nr:ribonucleotide reductase subunit alpha [Coriobacteriia bacterium]